VELFFYLPHMPSWRGQVKLYLYLLSFSIELINFLNVYTTFRGEDLSPSSGLLLPKQLHDDVYTVNKPD
jgi:hypothetical protein